MANTNAPFGFRQYAALGSAPTYEQVLVSIAYNASAIYFGDPVTLQSDGTIAQSADTSTPAALGIAGIFVGCKYLSTVQKRVVWSNYFPGSGDPVANTCYGYIVNDPGARFIVQSDSTGNALVDVNATIGFKIGTGNTANGVSGAYLDTATMATGTLANYPFRIISIVDFPPGAPGTLTSGQAYDQVIVAFNNVASRNFQGV